MTDFTNAAADISRRDAWERASRIRSGFEARTLYVNALASNDRPLVDAILNVADRNSWHVTTPLARELQAKRTFTVPSAQAGTAARMIEAVDALRTTAQIAPRKLLEIAPAIAADQTLSRDGRTAKIAAETADLKSTVATMAGEYLTTAQQAFSTIAAASDAATPRMGTDIESMTRANQKWEQARGLLESGRNLVQIVAQSDLEKVLAIQEFAPSWLAAQGTPPRGLEALLWSEPDQEKLVSNLVLARFMQIVDDPTAALLLEGRNGAYRLQQAENWAGALRRWARTNIDDHGHGFHAAAIVSQTLQARIEDTDPATVLAWGDPLGKTNAA
ncbi:hypothetical protein [Rathayibacter soli]|uniref:hypothetical protein n=1 Tax=Rathayibacter soli TaxID=3144168 RepID=UPI0027E4F7F2|nr:hypothetical protein [Glaciibacter superstes]